MEDYKIVFHQLQYANPNDFDNTINIFIKKKDFWNASSQ